MAQQNFLFIRRSEPGQAAQGPKPSPAQMEEMYAKFNAWKDKFSDSIVDMGAPLGGGRVVTSQGHSDGPFIEAKEVIGGYMVLSADSLEAAEAMVREMPGVVAPGASVEIREIPAHRSASLRYSGTWSEKRYAEHLEKLQNWLDTKGLQTEGEAVWARYNAPFTPWFMRRNEILIPLQTGP